MSLQKIADACGGTYHGPEESLSREVSCVVIDSRKIQKDGLFIAIRGARVDGHSFIPQVMEKGALCSVSEQDLGDVPYPYIKVDSCEQALKDIAEHYRRSLDIKVVGISGSVGKTSTKEMIASVLSQKYNVLKTEGNFNNEIGLPLTVFNLREEHEVAVLEMGISGFGEMTRLARIARPDICVITNIGVAHIENLGSRDGILRAKTEMFAFMNPDGTIILNGDDDKLRRFTPDNGIQPVYFGLDPSCPYHAEQIRNMGLKGTTAEFVTPSERFEAHISIPGDHMVYNALAGIAAESAEERVAAKVVLSHITLEDLRNNPAVPYEEDEVTRIIQDGVNETIYKEIKGMTVGEFREWLLDTQTTGDMIKRASRGLTSEMVAAVCKLMGNLDLVYAAKKIRITAHCNTTIGLPGTFSSRLQPNNTTDDIKGITASVLEGLSLGCGDAVIGLNPVDDSVENIANILKRFDEIKNTYEVPTQISVLGHVTTQMEAIRKFHAPIDLMFQSIAGSQKGNEAFGLTASMLDEGHDLMLKEASSMGPNVMYFETGQGSELSSEAHNGWDQVTMEARCYGFAKKYSPFLVNTVVGFIGPEYLYDSKQVIRAGLEDHFMGKLTGIPMGCDACYTNHMKADQNDIENLATLLVAAGCNYIMGVPQGDDCMLMYQCTGYHDSAALREIFGLRPIKEFDQWLEKMGFSKDGKLTPLAGDASVFLK